MITRIVRLSIRAEKAKEFQILFHQSYKEIRQFKGCRHLQLFRDLLLPNVFITFSIWETEQDLEDYRKSPFFTSTWASVKLMFDTEPMAFSMIESDSVSNEQKD